MFEELLSFSKEKIFLEPIDQYFEEESNNDEEDIKEGEVDLKKLDDELSKCLLLDNNDEISTSMESEEIINTSNKIPKPKVIKLTEHLYYSQENINKFRNEIIQEYYWIIQNKNQKDQC